MKDSQRRLEALLAPTYDLAARLGLSRPLACLRAWPFGTRGWSALFGTGQDSPAESWAVLQPGPECPRAVTRMHQRGTSRWILQREIATWPATQDPLVAGLYRWLGTSEPRSSPAIVGYKPLRRVVCRLAGDDGSYRFAKQMRPRAAALTAAHHQLLAGYWRHEAQFSLPRLVDQDPAAGRLVWRAEPGLPPRSIPEGPRLAAALRSMGRCLASLHRCPATLPRVHTRTSELAVLESWQRVTGGLVEQPNLLPYGIRVLAQAAEELPVARSVVVHGDLHDGQFLVGSSGITLLDLDTLGRAEPELDVGNLLAHLDVRRAAGDAAGVGQGRQLDVESIVLEGYSRQRGPLLSRPRILWYRALAALRLVLVHAPRPESRPLMPQLIALALERIETLDTQQEEHAS